MIITESQAQAILKKEIKVQARRIDGYNPTGRYSRKAYIRNSLNYIRTCAFVIKEMPHDTGVGIYSLMPDDAKSNSVLDLVITNIDGKAFKTESMYSGVSFSPHAMWRMMQHARVDTLKGIIPAIAELTKALVHIIHAEHTYPEDAQIYLHKYGKYVLENINNEIIVKTFVSENSLSPEGLEAYSECSKNEYHLVGYMSEVNHEPDEEEKTPE